MIRIKRTKSPAVLKDPGGPARREMERALAHYGDATKRKKSFKFKAYKHDDVKMALNALFHFKCAYCESYFGATAPVDVEHFRPKSAVERADGTLLKPGYYWLASDWDNLLPSCIDCNRARIHEHAEDDDPALSGKANLFPIESDHRASLDPPAQVGERRLLIHPCRDKAERFFRYQSDAAGVIVAPAKKRGRSRRKAETSIEAYGLNRMLLVQARGDQFVRLRSQVQLVSRCLELLGQDPDSEDRQRDLAVAVCELMALRADDSPYSGMVRFMMRDVESALNEKTADILGSRLDGFRGASVTDRLLAKFRCETLIPAPGDSQLADLLG